MKPEIIICDIDGTIANIQHRLHYIDPARGKKDWNSFFEKSIYDTQIQPTATIIKHLHNSFTRVGFVTGRPEKYRAITTIFVGAVLGTPEFLYMRPDNDRRPDYIVKEEIYLTKIAPYYTVKCVFDDRDQVVAMWRKHGLTCYQVAEGHF